MARKSPPQKMISVNPHRIIIVESSKEGRETVAEEMTRAGLADGQHFTLLRSFGQHHHVYLSREKLPQLVLVSHCPPGVDVERVTSAVKRKNPYAVVFAAGPDLPLASFYGHLRHIVYGFRDHPSEAEMVRCVSDLLNPRA